MNRDRILTLAIVGAIALVGVLGWLVGVSPILSQVASADDDRASISLANDANATRLIALKKQFENISDTQSKLDGLRASIPATADMSVFLRTIKEYGDAQGITLKSVEVSGVTAYAAPVAAAPVAQAGTAPATPSPSPSPSATAGGTAAPAPVPAGPANGLYVVPIKVSVTGTYAQVMAFAGQLQTGPRLFLVTNLALSSVDGEFTGDLTGNVYALPAPAPVAAAAAATATTP
ncbi:hypothetical protein [Frigoribacterium sp. UYMn621]|uniref:type 4a pilus biogenesis protein PilO n=1 Tax=Frigoribacterium sp. UYMn621 TaxID=3156343 RepID=UPI0033967347